MILLSQDISSYTLVGFALSFDCNNNSLVNFCTFVKQKSLSIDESDRCAILKYLYCQYVYPAQDASPVECMNDLYI